MATAVEKHQAQRGVLVDPSIGDNNLEIDVSRFLMDVVGQKKYDINVAGAIVDGNLNRTMDGASTLTITVNDHYRKILRSGIIGDGSFPAIEVNFDGLWMRLVQLTKSGDTIDFVFEDRIVYYLRQHKKPLKVSRRHMTRSQFIHSMVNEVKAVRIRYYSPEEAIKQDIGKVKTTKAERRRAKKPGFASTKGLKAKHVKANKKQEDVGATILAVGSDMGASRKALDASIAVATNESVLNPAVGGDYKTGTHIGAFQQSIDPADGWTKLGGGTGNLENDSKAFFKMCMKIDKEAPNLSASQLGAATQYPGSNLPTLNSSAIAYASELDEWMPEAKKWVKEFNGEGGDGGTQDITRRNTYYFMRGQPDGPRGENSWDASDRLAQEVNWRRFVVGNTFYYVQDADLMKQASVDTFNEDDVQVDSIDFDLDTGKKVQELTMTCRAVRWPAHPGEVVTIEESGPANGRWLVWEIDKPLFSENCTITLRKPQAQKAEPAPTTTSYTKQTSADKGTMGDVEIAAGADRAGVPTKKHVLIFLQLMAGQLGKKIVVTTGSHHNQYTTSGNVSDHWSGDAADLAMGANHFTYGGRGGDDIARAAAEVLGLTLKDVTGNWVKHSWTYKGVIYSVQVGWKTMEGGDHYNHVHIGVHKTQGRAHGKNYGPAGANVPGH